MEAKTNNGRFLAKRKKVKITEKITRSTEERNIKRVDKKKAIQSFMVMYLYFIGQRIFLILA